MSSRDPRARRSGACGACLRRGWLLSALSGVLDRCGRDRARLLELLALADDELLAAVAGRRASALRAAYECFDAHELVRAMEREPRLQAVCLHRCGYPRALSGAAAPHLLTVLGGADRLARLAAAPVVAILGSRRPSDYGRETARSLARGLAATGVTVAACFADGIAAAAHAGVLDAGAGGVAVRGDGLGLACSPRRRSLYERIARDGCAVCELPPDCAGRRWGQLASERIVVGLATLTVVVEAERTPEDLFAAGIARALGRPVAAIPGRVSSPLSRGAHALLIDGASLVRGPRDVLELLYAIGEANPGAASAPAPGADTHAGISHSSRAVLARVGAGYDTPDKLAHTGIGAGDVLPALSELELAGLVARGDGGRYLPRDPLDW